MIGGSGRCLCGALRYRFAGAPNWQSHCHCESCRRATASGFTSFLSVDRARLAWEGERAFFASSPGVRRGFCPVCGTQMSYETARRAHETDLYAATLDDPSAYAPELHDHWDEHLPWIVPGDRLPRIGAPRRIGPDEDMGAILRLVRDSFAFMEGRIDPPSSAGGLTPEGIAAQARSGEVWAIHDDHDPVACIFLTPKAGALYLGKLAVAARYRRKGFARALVSLAEDRARALGLPRLELQTRVELTENHAAFAAMGFRKTAETAHPGYDRPTSYTFVRDVAG